MREVLGLAACCGRRLTARRRVPAVNGVKDQINCKDLSCQQIIARVGQKTDAMDTEELLQSNGLRGLKLDSRVAASR